MINVTTYKRRWPRLLLMLLAACTMCPGAARGAAGIRNLGGFGDPARLARLQLSATGCRLQAFGGGTGATNQPAGAELIVARGTGWAQFLLTADDLANWTGYEVVTLDVEADATAPTAMELELWDAASHNYATRCTLDAPIRAGRQTLTWHIDRARRNNREGLDWNQLAAQDKIDLARLKQVKFILPQDPAQERVCRMFNLRLAREEALRPAMDLPIGKGWLAFDFGPSAAVAGFQTVPPTRTDAAPQTFGFAATNGLAAGGANWPDPLGGTYIMATEEAALDFRTHIPNGDYLVWLCAGKVIRPNLQCRRFLLAVNDIRFCDEEPLEDRYNGTNFLYRFLATPYSAKPHAVWAEYMQRMYPAVSARIAVTNGMLQLTAMNHFIGALVVAPAAAADEFTRFCLTADERRRAIFEAAQPPPPALPPVAANGVSLSFFRPAAGATVGPGYRPSAAETGQRTLAIHGAPGERVTLRVALLARADLADAALSASDLKGPATIPSSDIQTFVQEYRPDGAGIVEKALLPLGRMNLEAGVARCIWLWLAIPDRAPAGDYTGLLAVQAPDMAPLSLQVKLEVYPFRLETDLPAAFGLYYREPDLPRFPASVRTAKLREQLEWMRAIGLNSFTIPPPVVQHVDYKTSEVSLVCDPFWYNLARVAGMGRTSEQRLMTSALGMARNIGKRAPGLNGLAVDRAPGIELRQPGFQPLFVEALRQFQRFLEGTHLPVAVEVVDEPREMPNPWNRNLADTLVYADRLHAAGLTTFVTPMEDTQSGLDYTVLADRVDIVSTHSWEKSARLMQRTLAADRTLWLYNCGRDRLSWGFYAWRAGARGRWEWHFCWPEDTATGGYPGREWYNPFTGLDGLAPSAPYTAFRGGMLFKSDAFTIAAGITDYAYLLTLQKAIAASRAAHRRTDTAERAAAFLETLRQTIPAFLPLDAGARARLPPLPLDEWRSRIADFLKELDVRE